MRPVPYPRRPLQTHANLRQQGPLLPPSLPFSLLSPSLSLPTFSLPLSRQKKKAEGPLLPEQPTKKLKSSADHASFNEATGEQVKERAEAQGEKVRTLKASKASKVGHMTTYDIIIT